MLMFTVNCMIMIIIRKFIKKNFEKKIRKHIDCKDVINQLLSNWKIEI